MTSKLIALLLASANVAGVAGTGSPVMAEDDAAQTAKTGRVATEVFGRKANIRGPRLSPDGTKIAYQLVKGGQEYIAVLDLAKPGSPPKIIIAATEVREAGDRNVVAWRWVGNGHVVVTLQSREILFGSRFDIGRLAAFDLNTGKLTPLAWDEAGASAANILHIDHKKGTILLERDRAGQDTERWGLPEAVHVDVKTGKYTMAMRTNTEAEGWIADGKGVVRASVSTDRKSGKQRLMYRSDGKQNLKSVYNEADKTFTDAQIVPDIFTDEPDTAYALNNKDGFRKLYKVNLKTMEMTAPIFGSDGYDLGFLDVNIDGNNVDGVQVFDGKEYFHYFEPRKKEVQNILDEEFGKGNASIVDVDHDFKQMLVFAGKSNQLGGFYQYDLEGGSIKLLGWRSNVLKDMELNPNEAVRYKARDGMEIEAIVTYPRHRKSRENLPVVVMPHGGPFGIYDTVSFDPWTQALAEAGYVVIQPNYRGSGGYGREFVKEGRKPDGYGEKMQDDLNDAVAWFGKSGLIDSDRACIMGWSYGGYAAARGAQRDAKTWKCAIAGAGVYDFPKMKAYDARVFGAFGANYQATAENLVAISSARNTDGPWAPILIVAGKRDARIPLEQSRTLVSELKGSGKKEGTDFRYVEQAKGTHNLPYEDVHIEWLVEAEKWLERFNPAYIATDADKIVPITISSK